MTIRQKLLANLGIILSFLVTCFLLISWGAYRYSSLQARADLVNHQVQGWLTLNFQVSQYVKHSLEATLTGEPAAETRTRRDTGLILRGFDQMEETLRARGKFLTLSEQAREDHELKRIRDQFDLIRSEFEKTLQALRQGGKTAAAGRISSRVTRANLDTEFATLIESALRSEQGDESQIRGELNRLKTSLVAFFLFFMVTSVGTSVMLVTRVNRSIQRSIQAAKNELLRGTRALGLGDLSTQIQLLAGDELSVVAEAFNKMAKDLGSAWVLISQQQQSLSASAKMSALGEMAGGIAHEINNPLATIQTLASQLQEVLGDTEPDLPQVRAMAAQIEKTTVRIAKIIQGLRSFSRDGSADPFRPVRVLQLIEETLSFCHQRLKSKGTPLIVDEFDSQLTFEGRSVEISQVLLNLLNNAQDAVADHEERWIRITVRDQGEALEIHVTDSGKGIPPATRAQLFKPFFTTKEPGKGTGMGLSVSVRILQDHRGELRLDESCPNTRFVIRLPKNQTKSQVQGLAKNPGAPRAS